MTNQENNQAPKNQEQAPSWRDAIAEAVKVAREYAKDVADDYIAEWQAAPEKDRQDEAYRTASALRHAADWYGTADKIEEALKQPDDAQAAARIRKIITEAGETDLADWCCPIANAIGEAAKAAITEATTTCQWTTTNAQAAADLAATFANANRWG